MFHVNHINYVLKIVFCLAALAKKSSVLYLLKAKCKKTFLECFQVKVLRKCSAVILVEVVSYKEITQLHYVLFGILV